MTPRPISFLMTCATFTFRRRGKLAHRDLVGNGYLQLGLAGLFQLDALQALGLCLALFLERLLPKRLLRPENFCLLPAGVGLRRFSTFLRGGQLGVFFVELIQIHVRAAGVHRDGDDLPLGRLRRAGLFSFSVCFGGVCGCAAVRAWPGAAAHDGAVGLLSSGILSSVTLGAGGAGKIRVEACLGLRLACNARTRWFSSSSVRGVVCFFASPSSVCYSKSMSSLLAATLRSFGDIAELVFNDYRHGHSSLAGGWRAVPAARVLRQQLCKLCGLLRRIPPVGFLRNRRQAAHWVSGQRQPPGTQSLAEGASRRRRVPSERSSARTAPAAPCPWPTLSFTGVKAHRPGPRPCGKAKARTRLLPCMHLLLLAPGLLDLGGHGVVNFVRDAHLQRALDAPGLARLGQDMPRWGTHRRRARAFCPSGPARPCRPPRAPRAPAPFSALLSPQPSQRRSGIFFGVIHVSFSKSRPAVIPRLLSFRRFLHGRLLAVIAALGADVDVIARQARGTGARSGPCCRWPAKAGDPAR